MTEKNTGSEAKREDTLARMAEEKQKGILSEYWAFLHQEKKWWLAPFLLFILAVGAFAVLGGTAAAPFIYTLF